MTALRQAWSYTPMPDIQRRQFARLFAGYSTTVVRDVIDDLIRLGVSRPGPAEMGEMLRTKLGIGPAGHRAHRHGPFLDTSVDVAREVPSFVREALESGKATGAQNRVRRLVQATTGPQT